MNVKMYAMIEKTEDKSFRSDFWMILALFSTFRLSSLVLLRPGGFIRDWSDLSVTYLGVASMSDYGLFPYFDFWLEYPPLIPWLMVGSYKLSLLLPPWQDSRFWFTSIMGMIFLLFEIGNFILIYRLARLIYDDARVIRVLWLYAGLFPPFYAVLGFFDCISLFFILLSLNFILSNKITLTAVATGIGFVIKLIPILVAPVAIRYLWHRHREKPRHIANDVWRYSVVFVVTVLILLTPFLFTEAQWLITGLKATFERSSWETIWAVSEGYYDFGKVSGTRTNPVETNFSVHSTSLPWGIISIGFSILYGLILLLKSDYTRPRNVAALMGLTISLFLLYSKGYSPQFLVYILPFIILLMPNAAGLSYTLILTLLNILEQPIYFVILPDETWLLTTIVWARFITFIVLCIEFTVVLWPNAIPHPQVVRRGLQTVLVGATLIGLLVVIPKGMKAYIQNQLEESPNRDMITFLKNQATDPPETLILTEQNIYRQLYPYIRNHYVLKLVGEEHFKTAPSIAKLLEDEDKVWLLSNSDYGSIVNQSLASQGQRLAIYDFDDLGTLSVYTFAKDIQPIIPLTRTQNGIELLDYKLEIEASTLTLVLYWQAKTHQDSNYTVFTQVLDSKGQLVASHDSIPDDGKRPTHTWGVNSVIVDDHTISLPDDMMPDEYKLVAGMYLTADGSRLPLVDEYGQVVGDSVLLETIEMK